MSKEEDLGMELDAREKLRFFIKYENEDDIQTEGTRREEEVYGGDRLVVET